MLCYKDRTWCTSLDCANTECYRNTNGPSFTPDEFWKDRVCCAPLHKECKEHKTVVCARCHCKVNKDTSNQDYTYFCPNCCEDLYEIETETILTSEVQQPEEDDAEKCSKCGHEFLTGDNKYTIDDAKNLCEECTINILSESDNRDEKNQAIDTDGNAYAKCYWCEDLYPISEMREEKDMGYLCDYCIQGIISHGESLCLVYGGR